MLLQAPVSTVASPSEATDRAPSDLKATLSRAATGSGALSAFVAECFHHYESGQQYSWPEWLKPENLKDLQDQFFDEQFHRKLMLMVASMSSGNQERLFQSCIDRLIVWQISFFAFGRKKYGDLVRKTKTKKDGFLVEVSGLVTRFMSVWCHFQGLRPTDPGYNSSSLWVPDPIQQKGEYQKAQGHNTPMLMQYWKLKSTHFDKVAFFKVGKFYEIFYYDAFIAQRVCGLKWMSQDKYLGSLLFSFVITGEFV